MTLLNILHDRGLSFRHHLPEAAWTLRKPTIVDLTDEQAQLLQSQGLSQLSASLAQQNSWSIPAANIQHPLPRQQAIRLGKLIQKDDKSAASSVADSDAHSAVIVAPSDNAALADLAQKLAAHLHQHHGLSLSILSDTQTSLDPHSHRPLILIGGSHQNRLAMDLALRSHTCFLDAAIPGPNGWAIATHLGLCLHPSLTPQPILQLTAPPDHHASVIALFSASLFTQDQALHLKPVHHIQLDVDTASTYPTWPQIAQAMFNDCFEFGDPAKRPAHPASDPRELATQLAVQLDGGDVTINQYNLAPVLAMTTAATHYLQTGRRDGLIFFHQMLTELTRYFLTRTGGSSYIADFDFELGVVILYFSRLEHDPLFSDQDRLLFSNLLLACARSVHEYATSFWPVKAGSNVRHNHETFPAVSLLYAAHYFDQYIHTTDAHNSPLDLSALTSPWKQYVHEVLAANHWQRGKQCENAALYEPIVPLHALTYSSYVGQGLSRYEPNALRQVVMRQMMTTDNFLRQCDYGDTSVDMSPQTSTLACMLLAESFLKSVTPTQATDSLIHWFASAAFAVKPDWIRRRSLDMPGIAMPPAVSPATPATQDTQWEILRLDPAFVEQYTPGFPSQNAFDKLAMRTGWHADDHYLLVEGVGGKVSHGHHDAGGIVRLNHLGRHWVISNGYGKNHALANASQSYATRVTGPNDHNLLVLTQDDALIRPLPAAALQTSASNGLLEATIHLQNYGPVDWTRTYLTLPGQFLLVVDRVHILKSTLQTAHIEFNLLGSHTTSLAGHHFEQQDVFLHVSHSTNAAAQTIPWQGSDDWRAVLGQQAYPYSGTGVTKMKLNLPSLDEGDMHIIATLLAASNSGASPYTLNHVAGATSMQIQAVGDSQHCHEWAMRS